MIWMEVKCLEWRMLSISRRIWELISFKLLINWFLTRSSTWWSNSYEPMVCSLDQRLLLKTFGELMERKMKGFWINWTHFRNQSRALNSQMKLTWNSTKHWLKTQNKTLQNIQVRSLSSDNFKSSAKLFFDISTS